MKQLFKVATERVEVELRRQKEREDLEEVIKSVKEQHQTMIENMTEKIKYIREIKKESRLSDDDIKKLVSIEKKN